MYGVSNERTSTFMQQTYVHQSKKSSAFLEPYKDTVESNTTREADRSNLKASVLYEIFAAKISSNKSKLSAVDTKGSAKQEVENDRYVVKPKESMTDAFTVYDKVTGTKDTFYEAEASIQHDVKSGLSVLVHIERSRRDSYTGEIIPEIRGAVVLNDSLEQALNSYFGTEKLPVTEMTDCHIFTNEETGIQCVQAYGSEGWGAAILVQSAQDLQAFQDLAKTYRQNYPGLVRNDDMAAFYAAIEIEGMARRTEHGILKIFAEGMSYSDESSTLEDYSKNWSVKFKSAGMYELVMEFVDSHIGNKSELELFKPFQELFEKNNCEYERIWTEKELEQGFLFDGSETERPEENEQLKETETKSDIIINTDGSRVLVLTIRVGSMEITTSIEISKPTKLPNENAIEDEKDNGNESENENGIKSERQGGNESEKDNGNESVVNADDMKSVGSIESSGIINGG